MPTAKAETDAAAPSLLFLLKQVELGVRAQLDDLLRPAGLTALQYTVLSALERESGLTSAQLARNSFVTAQSMSDMIAALAAQGLVKRTRDPGDRRRLVLAPTAAGRRMLNRFRARVTAIEDRMLGNLSQRQVTELRRSLTSVHTALGG